MKVMKKRESKPLITIYGFGYVGQAVWRFLRDHYELQVFDPEFKKRVRALPKEERKYVVNFFAERGLLEFTRYAIICVPTPGLEDGSCDISAVRDVIRNNYHEYYLIKSTIPPGTCDALWKETDKLVCFSPEYIGEGKYMTRFWKGVPHPTDMKLHEFHIFGGPQVITSHFVEL